MVAQAFVRGCLNVLIVVAAFELLDGAGGTVGLLTAAIGAGGVIGAIVCSTLHSNGLARVFALSLLGWGLPIVLVAPRPELIAAVVLLGIVGAANSVEDVSGFTLLQRAIRDDALSSVLGLIWGRRWERSRSDRWLRRSSSGNSERAPPSCSSASYCRYSRLPVFAA